MITEETRERVLLLMLSGLSPAAVADAMAEKLGIPAEQIDAELAEARRRITLAATFNRDEELGRAILRLNDCYKQALGQKDPKTALTAERERIKLLRLDAMPIDTGGTGPGADELAAVRAQLEPLNLAPPDTNVVELCRLAVARIVALEARPPARSS